jgi:hypothetical protein
VLLGANLGLRFLLELAALAAVAWSGWQAGGSVAASLALAIALPIVVAVVWGAFVSPRARFDVPRPVWYGLQVVIFGAASLALASAWAPAAGIVFALVVAANLALLAIL